MLGTARFLVILFSLSLGTSVAALAQVSPEQTILEGMFRAKTIDGSVFDQSFTAQVPVAALQMLVDGYKQRLGALTSIAKDGGDYVLTFPKGSLRATIALVAAGKVSGLLFHDELSDADRAALERVLRADHVSADWFSANFLAQVSAARLDGVLSQIRDQAGKFVRVESRRGSYYSVFEKAASKTQISTDADGKITGLFFGPPTPLTSSLDDALHRLRPTSGVVSYLILEGRTDVERELEAHRVQGRQRARRAESHQLRYGCERKELLRDGYLERFEEGHR